MTQPNLIEQARQGNVKVIASLMNRLLKPQGMMADVGRTDDCLEILIESDKRSLTDKFRVPNREVLVSMIHKWLVTLGVHSFTKVKLSWQLTGQERPAWTQEFPLEKPENWLAEPHNLTEEQLIEEHLAAIRSFYGSNELIPSLSAEGMSFFQNRRAGMQSLDNFSVHEDATILQFQEQSNNVESIGFGPVSPIILPSQVNSDPNKDKDGSSSKSNQKSKTNVAIAVLQYALISAAIVGTIIGIHYVFTHSQPVKENTKAVITPHRS